MIKKLRKRFIGVALIAVLLVLAVMMCTINFFNYRAVIKDADTLLDIIAENGGIMPMNMGHGPFGHHPDGAMPFDREWDEDAAEEDSDAYDFDDPDESDWSFIEEGLAGRMNRFSDETPFESRYFTVLINTDGTAQIVSTESIASIGDSDAEQYARRAAKGGKTRGFLENYRYLAVPQDTAENAGVQYIFLECSRSLLNARSFLRVSLVVSLASFLIVGLLVILVSRRILRPVEESYAKQKSFITDAGHELKTPVAVIEADAAVLAMDLGENEWLTDIRRQTKRLAELTGELTYLARMDEGRPKEVMIEFPLSDVVSEMAASFQARAVVEEKEFRVDIAPMLSMTGEEAGIRKLVSILLDNAFKYSPAGGKIGIALRLRNRNTELVVRNTAEGLTKELLEHMFDRFYRGDKARSRAEGEKRGSGGYGLGLSIARSVVEAHKGKIAAAQQGDELVVTVLF